MYYTGYTYLFLFFCILLILIFSNIPYKLVYITIHTCCSITIIAVYIKNQVTPILVIPSEDKNIYFDYLVIKDGIVSDCPICMNNVETSCAVKLKCPCVSKLYHKECIDKWLESHERCPICQTKIYRTYKEAVITTLRKRKSVQSLNNILALTEEKIEERNSLN